MQKTIVQCTCAVTPLLVIGDVKHEKPGWPLKRRQREDWASPSEGSRSSGAESCRSSGSCRSRDRAWGGRRRARCAAPPASASRNPERETSHATGLQGWQQPAVTLRGKPATLLGDYRADSSQPLLWQVGVRWRQANSATGRLKN